MEDPHRAPKDRDRSALVDRITKVAAEGRIGTADRDIRLGNVRSAQSMAELDLIARDLDLLEQTLAPGSAPPPVAFPTPQAPAAPEASPGPVPEPAPPVPDAPASTGTWEGSTGAVVVDAVQTGAKRVAVTFVVVLVLAIIGAAVAAVLVFRGADETSTSGEAFDPVPVESDDPGDPSEPEPEVPAADDRDEPTEPYSLRADAIRAFLAAYQRKFGTTRVVDLTLYDDYAIVRVPVPGKARNTGWLYRPGQGWRDFGGVTANFPGSAVIDIRRLDVAALMRNIDKARRTLKVEEYNLTYVNIDYRPQSDDAVNVNIYVSNPFHESGYLATTLDGTVERAYPFGG